MNRRQQGFTLIEIAIVLVIIGLLLSGVVKGQELIVQARIKNVANDFNGLASAIYGYQDRYKTWPGDDGKAGSRWSGATNGDLDGVLEGAFNSKTDSDESRLLWSHLRLAGFVGGDPASAAQASNAAGGILGVQTNAGLRTVGGVSSTEQSGQVICASNLSGKIANAIDAQLDDANPDKGNVRAYLQSGSVTADGGSNPTAAASASAYTDDGNAQFTVCRTL